MPDAINYRVQLEVFDGPVELLLYLVQKEELDIFDVPIARITDEYLKYLASSQKINLEFAADFLVMAIILIRWKMRALLPSAEKEPVPEPTVNLEAIFAEFQKYKRVAVLLSELEVKQKNRFPRPNTFGFEIEGTNDPWTLSQLFHSLISKLTAADSAQIARLAIRLEEKILFLRTLLRERQSIDFSDAASEYREIGELIVLFFATLELARLGEIAIEQNDEFGTIVLRLKLR